MAACPTQPARTRTQKAGASNRNRAAESWSKRQENICLDPFLNHLGYPADQRMRIARSTPLAGFYSGLFGGLSLSAL